jgi:hypothetical protein
VCWFKASAAQHIARIHEIVCILEQNGVFVHVCRTDRPGYIVYEDEFQIVAEPFADLRL